MLRQLTYPLPGLPLILILRSDGVLGFATSQKFSTIVSNEKEYTIIIDMNGIMIGDTEIEYNTLYPYKQMPELLSWLQSLELELPEGV